MAKLNLNDLVDMTNIADEANLEQEYLNEIGQKVLTGYKADAESSTSWLNDVRRVTQLAIMESKKKSKPLPNSANTKYPLITKACMEWASTTYPEIIKDKKVVKYSIIGKDTMEQDKDKQGTRTSAYMNYQLLQKNTEWENDLDMLLNQLPLIGFLCKKQRYNPVTDEVESELCHYEDLIVNEKIKSLKTADRISHKQSISLNELVSYSRSGVYLEQPIKDLILRMQGEDVKPNLSIIEQHCFLDLDEDDYEEPYIVTILEETGEVLRISARFKADDIERNDKKKIKYIKATQYFKDFHFLKSPKGTFRGVGFGILLLHMNEMVNSLSNMILDAGQLANLQGGYIDSGFKVLESGDSLHDPGQFKKIKRSDQQSKLADGIMQISFKEPSQVLHAMLGVLVEAAKEVTSSTDVMSGASSPENSKTGATMALIQQGQKLSNSIQKRFYRSLTEEFRGIFDLNYYYLDNDVYVNVLGDELAVSKDDFDCDVISIIPVADPNLASESTKMQSIQILMAAQQLPGTDKIKISKRILDLSTLERPEELMMDEEAMNAPNPDIIQIQADIEHKAQQLNIEGRKLDLEEKRLHLDLLKTQSEIILNRANAMKAAAQADQAQAATQLDMHDQQLKAIQAQLDHMLGMAELQQDDYHKEQDRMQQQQEHKDNTDLYQQEVDNNAQQVGGMASPSSE